MATDPKMLSVAEVCEMQAGDKVKASWIEPGFQGVVRSINPRQGAKKTWPCIIADTVGSATLEICLFQAPKFSEGDQIEISGKGLRRTEFNGKPQAAIGKETQIHVLGRSVHHEEQVSRAQTGQPSVNGQLQPVAGQSVGMAIKEALTALVPGNQARLNSTSFWFEVHQFASDVIRVSRLLEVGKLAPGVRERNSSPSVQTAPPAIRRSSTPPTEAQQANLDDGPEQDSIPF